MSSLQASSTSTGHRQDRNDARRIRALERTVGELRERIRELEGLLLPDFELPLEWGLNRREAQVFRALLGADVISMKRLAFALYADEDDDIPPETVQSHVSHVRAKLCGFGVIITNRRNVGYSLHDRMAWRATLG